MKVKELAKFMHDSYEEEAKKVGWNTQDKCKVEFEDLPKQNKLVMLKIAGLVIKRFNHKEKSNNKDVTDCPHCKTKRAYSELYDAYYCPKCKFWLEKICPDRKCEFCKDRPKYPQ